MKNNTIETAKNTVINLTTEAVESQLSSGTTVFPFGMLCANVYHGAVLEKVTDKVMKSNEITDNFKNLQTISNDIFDAIAKIIELRLATARSEADRDNTKKAQGELRDAGNRWFMTVGTRNAKTGAIEANGKTKERRAIILVSKAEVAVFAHIHGVACKGATSKGTLNLASAKSQFMQLLIKATGAYLVGGTFDLLDSETRKAALEALKQARKDEAANNTTADETETETDTTETETETATTDETVEQSVSIADAIAAFTSTIETAGLDAETMASLLRVFTAKLDA